MYQDFYNLQLKPFQLTPDPAFLFWADSHAMAFAMLRYGLMNSSPLSVITGEVGSGKTTLVRQLLTEFPKDIRVGLISNLQPGKGALLEWLLMAFELPYEGRHVELFQRFQNFAIDTYALGQQVVLIIDEAQNLESELLEELRMLSNINTDRDQLLQIILVGQPELREQLNRPEMRQFSQRITSDFHLAGLGANEVEGYIRHRLKAAGATREIFPTAICDLIYHATGGIPRLVNVLCDLCLACGFSAEREVIDEDILRELMTGIENNGIYNQFKPFTATPKLVSDSSDM